MERAGRGCPGGFGVPVPGGVQWLDTGLGDEVGIRHRLELMILEGFSSLAIPGSHEAPNTKSQCPTPKLPGTHSSEHQHMHKPQGFSLNSLSTVCFQSQLVLHTSPTDLSILFWLSTSTTELNFGRQGICIISAEISGCSISLLLVCLGLARHC